MRCLVVASVFLALAGCSKAPESAENVGSGNAVTDATGVAFNYGYGFRLPSAQIADAQERHAQSCERLGANRCRITGMSYDVDDTGTASASLQMKLAAPIARAFAREGVKAIESLGGALIGASITGVEAAIDETAETGAQAQQNADRVRRDLDRPGLSPAERAELLSQRDASIARERESRAAAAAARASIAETPVAFRYEAGQGVGFGARVAGAWQTALSSLAATLGFALDALALLGPPLLLLLALFVLWRRVLARWWTRIIGERDGEALLA